jgi:hypothetical protein
MSAGIVRRTLFTGAGVMALVMAVSGVGMAAASPRYAAVSGTEHFQFVTASANAKTAR